MLSTRVVAPAHQNILDHPPLLPPCPQPIRMVFANARAGSNVVLCFRFLGDNFMVQPSLGVLSYVTAGFMII